MTPQEFIRKWKPVALTERASAHTHFNDLCAVVGHDDPVMADPKGESFTFEKGASKTGGGDGFADVWKKDFFAWEYKKRKRNLDEALGQLVRYAAALENPPLQVACDTDKFLIRTAWTREVPKIYEFTLDELAEPRNLDILHSVFFDPDKLRPKETRAGLTKEAADKFSTIASRLQGTGSPSEVAHFVNQLVFCFFAHSVKLLPNGFFPRLLKRCSESPENATRYLDGLFAAMEKGGDFDLTRIAHFNGGLFDGRRALPLDFGDVGLLTAASDLDWSQIDPTIFGTLFERFLDPEKRGQIGAHYTDPDKIMMIIEPVILRPLREKWAVVRAKIAPITDKAAAIKPRTQSPGDRRDADAAARRLRAQAIKSRDDFLHRLSKLSILDPACGSGNFLYLALQGVKDIENRAVLECEAMGLPPRDLGVGPEILHGIEINALAAELARTTIWIGDIQWGIRNGIYARPEPILRPLDSIECRDALLALDGKGEFKEAEWPDADFIVGNPPFLGAKLMKRKLGVELTDKIRSVYDRLPGFTDLVCYWFEKGRALIEAGKEVRVGLVATSSIRKNTNLPVMHRIASTAHIFEAWSEEKWTVEGAAVDVSLICFGNNITDGAAHLNGKAVASINADLTSGLDLTQAKPLPENKDSAFLGIQKSGPFDVPGALARAWMIEPANPNGRGNAEVLKPYWNGDDLTGRPRDVWFIDLPLGLSKADAALFATPFNHIETTPDEEGKLINELRAALDERAGPRWWEPHWPRTDMRSRIERLRRYIVTGETAEYRLFTWLAYPVLPDKNLIVIPREDDLMFGLLQSRFHDAWARRKGSDLQDRSRYTHTSTFATYPFPEGLTPNIPPADTADDPRAQRIAVEAMKLDVLRCAWLNPPDLVDIVPEVTLVAAPGEEPRRYPDRIVPKTAEAAAKLKERTLTKLYNERPRWLALVHEALDSAVAAAYGWPENIATEDALALLLSLNLERANAEALREQ
jgi:hypothetical protein